MKLGVYKGAFEIVSKVWNIHVIVAYVDVEFSWKTFQYDTSLILMCMPFEYSKKGLGYMLSYKCVVKSVVC